MDTLKNKNNEKLKKNFSLITCKLVIRKELVKNQNFMKNSSSFY